MGIREEFWFRFQELTGQTYNPETASTTEIFFDSLYPIIIISFIGLLGFFGYRMWKHISSYAGDGEPLGPFKITIQGLTSVKGNLSKHYFISDAEYDLLKTLDHKAVAENIQDFRDRVEKGELYVYDFRITDYDEAFDLKGGRDSIVLSPVDLEHNVFSWLDVKGERSITSPTFRIKHRNIVCFSESKYYQDQSMATRDVDIYDLVPIPKILTTMKLNDKEQVVLNLTKLADASSDATTSEYLKTLSENWQKIKPLEDEIKRLRDIILKKDIEIADVYKQGEHDRHIAYTNPIIGHRKKDKEIPKSNLIGILMAMFLAGGMSALLPEMIPTLNISGMLTLMAGAGIVFFIVYMMIEKDNSKPQPQESKFQT